MLRLLQMLAQDELFVAAVAVACVSGGLLILVLRMIAAGGPRMRDRP